jgi:NAD(P)-dependent dehydrogenase (short-subunit alcohol dehydrogenase family)
MNIMITGAAGGIGSTLALELTKKGNKVIVAATSCVAAITSGSNLSGKTFLREYGNEIP